MSETNWEPVGGVRNTIDIKKFPDKSYIGTYVGDQKIKTKLGEQYIYNFFDEDGEAFGIYGFTLLNKIMENIKENTLCRITYKGTKRMDTKYGKDKEVHQVLVETEKKAA